MLKSYRLYPYKGAKKTASPNLRHACIIAMNSVIIVT